MKVTKKQVEAGNRIKLLFARAVIVYGSPLDAFRFMDRPQADGQPTPRRMAMESNEGLDKAIRLMDQHLVKN